MEPTTAERDKPSATTTVFDLPELLENILTFADPIQLFELQRVNSAFQYTIAKSSAIRQRMRLEILPDDENDKQLQRFLEDLRINVATAPVYINAYTKKGENKPSLLNCQLDCDWYDALREDRIGLWSGSWQKIQVKHLADKISCVFSCDLQHMGRKEDWAFSTLGELVHHAISTARMVSALEHRVNCEDWWSSHEQGLSAARSAVDIQQLLGSALGMRAS